MDVVDVIKSKRDGARLSDEQIAWFIESYSNDSIPHYQAAALLMAILVRGMEPDELAAWTEAMISSGTRLDLSAISRPTVDKHSTGGVGDKVSLPLAPLIACNGAAVPMLSGRGLGHTGGTLDKLETIPGLRVDLSGDEMAAIVAEVGCAICSAGPDLAPADRKLYALRDVTGTVESIPLIASSVMSKKIAEGTSALVLDVKVGSGAFMQDLGQARALAETMVELGQAHGVHTTALITDMDQPLGRAVGNAVEVTEALEILDGRGPADLLEVTLALAEEMLSLAGIDGTPSDSLNDGTARSKWDEMVRAQGGDPDTEPQGASERLTVGAPSAGFVTRLDARRIGIAAWRLGAGRATKDEPVSPTAGILIGKPAGHEVAEGEAVLELHVDDPRRVEAALEALEGAIEIGPEPPEPRRLVLERIAP